MDEPRRREWRGRSRWFSAQGGGKGLSACISANRYQSVALWEVVGAVRLWAGRQAAGALALQMEAGN